MASKRSGDLDPLLETGFVLGGDFGELIVTEGVSCGVDPKFIDIGRLCTFLGGDADRGRGTPAFRGVIGLSPLLAPEVLLHDVCGLVRSRETLPRLPKCAVFWCRNFDLLSCGDGTASFETLAFLRASKCDKREETGL